MSIADYIIRKEYIVSVENFEDLDSIYEEIETNGKTPPTVDLTRSVDCIHRRPTSRNTHYMLTDWEAADLANDIRIKSVSLAPYYLGIKAGTTAVSQTSTAWDKSGSTSNSMKNWGLLRCTEGEQRSNWGGTGYEGNGTGTPSASGTIQLTQTGRNVDVVVCDLNGIVWNHPEYAVNEDGTGGTRTQQYNWYQHNAEIGNGSNGTYTYGTGDHSTHVAGTIAGNTQGWARSANIYNLYYDTGNPGNFSYVFDYIRAFHRNKAINNSTGRKNPTIVNNSWGQSIFPSEWAFSDITAVTYRGTRYTPNVGSPTYTGYSGVCTANERLATLAGFENYGNRITTTGPYTPPAGYILTKPAAWTQQGQQAFLTLLSAPDSTYTLTVQGPADVNLIVNVAADAISGSMSLYNEVIITKDGLPVDEYHEGPYTTTNGGTLETNITQSISLLDSAVYTFNFNTTLDVSGAGSPLVATAMSLTVVTDSHAATADVTTITNSLLGAASLTSSTTPTAGSNDDGYWTLALPFSITYLGTSYSTIYVSTNHYLTFGAGSTIYTGLSATTPNLPKIMWSCADNSVQRIYYGVEGAGSGAYTVTNSGASAYTINSASNPTLTLQRGGTYTFNVSAGGHPFWIQTVSGAYSSGNVYNTGVTNNGTQSGTITFTVPNDAPSTLYYVCEFHSSMQGTINVVAGTRSYRVRVEGAAAISGTLGSPTMVNEYVFYEDTPAQIDLQVGANGRKTVGSGFTTGQLNSWGFVAGQRIPARVAACDVDLEDLYSEGIIMVGAAGNGRWKHDVPGGLDWNNSFEMASRYPGSVAQPYFYMRGTSPTANDNSTSGTYDLPAICVGSIDTIQLDQKVAYSDCGPGVDLFAPGTYIISALPSGVSDSRNASYYLGKFSGTSMASPQVCGVLACALEVYPNMNQSQAKEYILSYAKSLQLSDTHGGAVDGQDLQDAANLVLYYYKERAVTGNTFPKINYKHRPASGSVYPRPRIRRTL